MKTREQWLHEAIDLLSGSFDAIGVTLPTEIHVSVGLPNGKGSGKGNHTIGECWPTKRSEDGKNHVFICPTVSDPVEVLNILCHELIHVSDDCVSGHRGHFVRVMKDLGLDGKATATTPGEMETVFTLISEALGPFPHAALNVKKPKQVPTTIRAECPACGWNCRVSHKWASVGLPKCPCGERTRREGNRNDYS
jgi:hypothetical protein